MQRADMRSGVVHGWGLVFLLCLLIWVKWQAGLVGSKEQVQH